MSEITELSAVQLSAAIHARKVSCAEVMSAYLDRIEALNPAVNAIVALRDRGALMDEAAACDAELAAGHSRGPLHGFPHAVKDLEPVAGLPFTRGSPIFRDFVAPEDGLQAGRLRAAGAVFIGKTNAPEFGLGSHTFNEIYGPTRNPYDLGRSAGGSSGGAAVVLALRLTPLADGGDYGGSLRNPAGWNNVLGFRTSIGRVPDHVREDWLPSMGVLGPMARSVGDLAFLLSLQAGHDPRAPLSLPGDGSEFLAPLAGDVAGKRIGWLGDFGGETPCEAGVLELCETALKSFEALGCVVEPALPDHRISPVWEAFKRLRQFQSGSRLREHYDDAARRPLMKPEAVFEVEGGLKLSAFDVATASAIRSDWGQSVRRLFGRYDYLVAPTAQVFPFPIGERWPAHIGNHTMQTYHEWMKGCCLVTMSGAVSLAAPAGFDPRGLPMGLQLIAPPQAELAALRLAHAYEQATDWVAKRPPPAAQTA